MQAAGVGAALTISTRMETFPQVLRTAQAGAELFASVGVHPDEDEAREPTLAELQQAASDPKVVAIGETGLDYYRLKGRNVSEMQWQRDRFRLHLRAARATGLPLVIHTRAASEDTLRIMVEEGAGEVGGVMHCFTESWEVARAALDLGFHISFSGIVTFKSAQALREVARQVPLERLLVETDSPYLAPVPYRGKSNEPAWVQHVAQCVAELRNLELAPLAQATSNNFFRLFSKAVPPPGFGC